MEPKSIFRDIYYHPYKNHNFRVHRNAKDDSDMVQRLGLLKKLQIHQGCVNTISWNSSGEYLLSGSDDQHLIITNGHTYRVESRYCTSHHANIFSAKFLPFSNDKQIVSCSGDGIVLHTDLEDGQGSFNHSFRCHLGTTYEVVTIPNDPNTFLSCGEDGTVRWFDLRTKTSCRKPKCKEDILVNCERAITALAINPNFYHQLAIGCADSTVKIFDRRFLTTAQDSQGGNARWSKPISTYIAANLVDRKYRITSLNYNASGSEMLVSYSTDYLYLFNVRDNDSKVFSKHALNTIQSNSNRVKEKVGIRISKTSKGQNRRSPPPVRRLRLRGDWSDTGPYARPERDSVLADGIGQARPQLQPNLMQRMTDVLSRMLNDPVTRAALSAGGEDSLDPNTADQRNRRSRRNVAPDEIRAANNDPDISNDSVEMEHEIQDTSTENESSSSNTTNVEELVEENVASGSSGNTPRYTSAIVRTRLFSDITELRDLRNGFIEQHGAEPSVSLRYSEQSTANATISLKVNNPLVRSNSEAASDREPSLATDNNTADASTSSASPQTQVSADVDAASTVESDNASAEDLDTSNMDMDAEVDDVDDSTEDEDDLTDTNDEESCDRSDDINALAHCTSYRKVKNKFVGHRNARTMIKEASFWGDDYVMSGSDCGHVFIWNKHTAKLKMLLQADQHVVNCLQPHPTLPLLATSGIDHDVKLWAPILESNHFDESLADDLINRNAIMLEETRDTITVPATFMIRMLSCLNHIRRSNRSQSTPGSNDEGRDLSTDGQQ